MPVIAKSKRWSFTVNNFTNEEYMLLKDGRINKCDYGIMGKEIGEEGTPHIQGYLSATMPKGLSQLKKINCRAHWEKSKGTSAQNRTYCSKDGIYEEWGEIKEKGQRTDLKRVFQLIKDGKQFDELVEETEGAVFKMENVVNKMIMWKTKKERCEFIKTNGVHALPCKDIRFYYGATGTGKTSSAIEEFPDAHIQSGCRWFDGYCGQETVIFDEFVGKAFPPEILLRLTDKYPMRVEIKGGFVEWNPKVVIFTTNLEPQCWFAEYCPAHQDAIDRRISIKKHFT
ncbi:rep protein [Circoviridae sp.]|nr:rep protein [Circoviridae sp.]